MSLRDGPLTGAPLGIPSSSLTTPNVTLYEMVTPQMGVGHPSEELLLPMFESAVEVSSDFLRLTPRTLRCENAGKYLVSANLSVINDGGIPPIIKQADFECTVNGSAQSAAVVRRVESAMYDTTAILRRTMPMPASAITLAKNDEVQFWFSYQGGGGTQTYNLDTYDAHAGALVWALLEHIG